MREGIEDVVFAFMRSPRVPNAEPLRLECEHFVQCIREGRTPLSDGESGLRVVRILEGMQRELDASRRGAAAHAAL
jgi:predicted dehydrogenase